MKSKKLPTILGMIILLSGLVAGIFLINSEQIFKLGAQVESSPRDVKITNVTNNSFTVTWITDNQSTGFVKWSKTNNNFNKIAAAENESKNYIHSVEIKGLENNEEVFFIINSDGSDFKNNGLPWKTTTLSNTVNGDEGLFGSGIILEGNGATPSFSLVYLTINGTTLSTTTSPEGNWIIPISNIIGPVSENTPIEINATPGRDLSAQAIIYKGAIKSTPAIILGKTYDFRTLTNEEISDLPKSNLTAPKSVEVSSRFEITKDKKIEKNIVTLESLDEGEIITTTDPEFFGSGPTQLNIEISVESELQTITVSTDKNGEWKWNPPNDLEPGEHKVTLKWTDTSGVVRTLTRNFVVSAAEGPAFESTPSATPEVSTTPSATPSTRPTITSTGTPQPVPETGYLTNTLGLFMIGIGLVLTGYYVNKKAYN